MYGPIHLYGPYISIYVFACKHACSSFWGKFVEKYEAVEINFVVKIAENRISI